MADTISSILAQGGPVDVDLLLNVPSSNNTAQWQRPGWIGYTSQSCPVNVKINNLPGGLAFEIISTFLSSTGLWEIKALGFSYNGDCLFISALDNPAYIAVGSPFRVQTVGQIQPVQS